MTDPITTSLPRPVGSADSAAAPRGPGRPASAGEFAAALRQQLEQVSRMQTEAEAGIQGVLTGRVQNVTEVLAAARKAEVAFGLLMEIRNKLVDAYTELKRMQV